MLVDCETPDKINELYEAIANHRNVLIGGLKGTKDEIEFLHDYIMKTGSDDEFLYNLLRYRLENKTNMKPKEITEFMEREYSDATKIRLERQEKEIKHEESESIKDEIGDELKNKTESQNSEEQQAETMWQNRFKSWDRDAVKLPNSAKRKEEAIKVIKNIEEQKRQQKKQKEQDDSTNR